MKISTEMTHAAYEEARKIYEGNKQLNEALDYLQKNYRMNPGSAKDYIHNFKKMMNGELYTRTNNLETTKYYLENIYKHYGVEKLRNAVDSLKSHIDYYENLVKGNTIGLRLILEEYTSLLNANPQLLYPDEIEVTESLFEGTKRTVTVNSYERSTKAREICIKHHGVRCSVCKINFESIYGEIGKDFIHVHHIVQLSSIRKEYEIDPVNDLRPVCPNCHSMLHRKNPPYSIEEMKQHLKINSNLN